MCKYFPSDIIMLVVPTHYYAGAAYIIGSHFARTNFSNELV